MVNYEYIQNLKKEGDEAFNRKDYITSIYKYGNFCDYDYSPEVKSKLIQIANHYLEDEIKEIEWPDNETLINLGEALLGNNVLNTSLELKDPEEELAYRIFINFIPYEQLPREVNMWMNCIQLKDA